MEEFSQSRKEFLWLLEMRVVTGIADGGLTTPGEQRRHLGCDIAVPLIQRAGDDQCWYIESSDFLPERRLPTNTKSP